VRAGDRSTSSRALDRRIWPRCTVSRMCSWMIPSLVFGGRLRSDRYQARRRLCPSCGQPHPSESYQPSGRSNHRSPPRVRCAVGFSPPWLTAGDLTRGGKLGRSYAAMFGFSKRATETKSKFTDAQKSALADGLATHEDLRRFIVCFGEPQQVGLFYGQVNPCGGNPFLKTCHSPTGVIW
jgi:hypothetical protein